MTEEPSVDQLADYLRGTGWIDTGLMWRGAGIWALDSLEVLLPGSSGVEDFPQRVSELLRTVSRAEGRPADEVRRALRHPAVDEITVRRDSTLTISEGASALQGLRSFIRESARAVSEGPHLRFPKGEPRPVRDLLDAVDLGPGPQDLPGFSLLLDVRGHLGRPSHRAVSLQVRDAARALAETVGNGGASFEDVALQGVSLECCSALARLAGEDDEAFEFSFRWAMRVPGLDRPVADGRVEKIGFAAGSGEGLRTGMRRLSRSGVSGPARAAGMVDGLHDEPGSDDRWRARLSGEVAPAHGARRGRTIWVRFPDQATYERVVRRYDRSRPVRVRGELTSRDGRIELMVDNSGGAS
ncbi:hypothetical protein WHI96_19350 [Pseudonocardia tropica]|uniref:Helicase XPB/Ssl2 N-terminal domain-containing protein n=1 Tax=Pseudonocardia tropica TaxID=681289 RepID=A0ABV1JYC1_9PSEU